MGKLRHFLTELSARDTIMAGYYGLTLFIIRSRGVKNNMASYMHSEKYTVCISHINR